MSFSTSELTGNDTTQSTTPTQTTPVGNSMGNAGAFSAQELGGETSTQPTKVTPTPQVENDSHKTGDTWSNWSPDQPLTSYGAATRGAVGGLVDDTLDAVKGAIHVFNPLPQSDGEKLAAAGGPGALYIYRMLNSMSPIARAAMHPTEIAAAIHEINSSKDPTGTYLKIAQRTASQGAGQAITALATEGAVKAAPAVARVVPEIAGKAKEAITPSEAGLVSQVLKGRKVAQPGAQAAVREATQSGVEAANTAAAAREATQSAVKVPPEYQDLIDEAMKQEPVWTPEKAQPVIKSLGDNFEVKGSVGEGKVTNNDLDIWQKTGKLSEASDKLTDLGFKKAYDTEHGEVWTNEKTGQNVDLWDAQHEPKAGFGPDQTPEPEEALPIANKKSPAVSPNAPLLKGNTTILDDHLDTLAENEKTAYKRMDDTAGFDIKAERQQLANDKYKLSQLGNTDVDITQRGKLIESINDSEARIAQANAKMKTAGVDPNEADVLHRQRMAGQDFKKTLTRYTNADGSVNVKGLLRGSKQLRFSKYGDRLEQFFGSTEAADKFVNQLDSMDKLGTHAVKARWVAGLVGGYVLPKIVGHTIGGQVGNVIKALP